MGIKTELVKLLTGKSNLLDELTFILAISTFIIGTLIVINSISLPHVSIGVLIILSAILSILTIVVPFPKLRDYTDIGSFIILMYGFVKSDSITAMTIAYQSVIALIIVFTTWKFAIKHLYKKRGE